MSKETIKETVAAYTVPVTQLAIPQEWNWLMNLTIEERLTFLQEIINALATAQKSGDWAKVAEQITIWEKRAVGNEAQALVELKQQFIEEGGSPEVASLLGKYRGQLGSVDDFIQNKQFN